MCLQMLVIPRCRRLCCRRGRRGLEPCGDLGATKLVLSIVKIMKWRPFCACNCQTFFLLDSFSTWYLYLPLLDLVRCSHLTSVPTPGAQLRCGNSGVTLDYKQIILLTFTLPTQAVKHLLLQPHHLVLLGTGTTMWALGFDTKICSQPYICACLHVVWGLV